MEHVETIGASEIVRTNSVYAVNYRNQRGETISVGEYQTLRQACHIARRFSTGRDSASDGMLDALSR